LRRLVGLVILLWLLSTLLFICLRLSGDPVKLLAADAQPEQIEAIRKKLGLSDPILVQYQRFMTGILPHIDGNGNLSALDFGDSFRAYRPARDVVGDRIPATLLLGLSSLALAIVVAIPAGIFSAASQSKGSGFLVTLLTLVGQSIPSFCLGILLILLFSVQLRILPAFGYGEAQNLILPVLTLAAFPIARLSRLVRSEMLEVLGQDYVRTARSKGLTERAVLIRHGLRNALLPVITVIGFDFAFVVGGSVIVETIFAWPGIGRQMVSSALDRDYAVVQTIVFLIGSVVVLANLVVDLLYRILDPRIELN
jgi:peptide/nickel transport system permease protein